MKKYCILIFSNKEINFEKINNNYEISILKIKFLSAENIFKKNPDLIIIETIKNEEIFFINETLEKIPNTIIDIIPIILNIEFKNNSIKSYTALNKYLITKIPLVQNNIDTFVSIGTYIQNKCKEINSLNHIIKDTREYLTYKIDNLLLLDYCLKKIAVNSTTEDIIKNTLKLLINPKIFGYKNAYFFFEQENNKYKYYKNNNKQIVATKKIPNIVEKTFFEKVRQTENTSITIPIFISNKVFGVFYFQNLVISEEELIMITLLFLKHISLKLTMSELQFITEELKNLNRSKDTFISLISHELRTPISVIMPSIEYLSEQINELDFGEEKKTINEFLEGLKENVNRLYMIIEDIILYSSIVSGQKIAEKISNKPFMILKNLFNEQKDMIIAKGIKYDFKISSQKFDKRKIELDIALIKKGINIIIMNAVKFRKDIDPFIKINIYLLKDYLVIEIRDNGIGMTESDQKKLFNKFEIFENINHHHKGLGLNLSLAKLIFEKCHEGKLDIKSQNNIGTTAKIFLKTLS
jgi:signal transduction histidine kinase